MLAKAVAKRVLDARGREVGVRVSSFKKRGGLAVEGSLSWAAGCFKLEFS